MANIILRGSHSLKILNIVFSVRIDHDNSIFMKLQVGSSMRDLTNELQVAQSYVTRIRKKILCNLCASSGGRPLVLANAQK